LHYHALVYSRAETILLMGEKLKAGSLHGCGRRAPATFGAPTSYFQRGHQVSPGNAEDARANAGYRQDAGVPAGSRDAKAGTNVLAEATANLGVRYEDGSSVHVSQTIQMTGFID
jgi:hypothetical protein